VGESFTLGKIYTSKEMETHVSYGTIQSVFEEVVSCTLFPYENWITFW